VRVLRRRGVLAVAVTISVVTALNAQRQRPFTRGFRQALPRFATADSYDGAFSSAGCLDPPISSITSRATVTPSASTFCCT